MSSELIKLPHFTISEQAVTFLDQYAYCNLGSASTDQRLLNQFLLDEGIVVNRKAIAKHQTKKQKILVLEPHPDDFALSASGYVLNALEEGAEAVVLNLFSKTSTTSFPWADKVAISEEKYESLRILESQIAIESYLGEKLISCKLPLASLRGRPTFSESENEDELVEHIKNIISNLVQANRIDTVLCPMGVMGHVDHLVVYQAAVKAFLTSRTKFNFIFYEDMPYSRNKVAYWDRLKQLKKSFKLKSLAIPTQKYLEIIADLIIIYRSQFDDINRAQMLAIIKEDFRANANSYYYKKEKGSEFVQCYLQAEKK